MSLFPSESQSGFLTRLPVTAVTVLYSSTSIRYSCAMMCFKLPCSGRVVRCSAVQRIVMQYSVPGSAVQYSAVQCSGGARSVVESSHV